MSLLLLLLLLVMMMMMMTCTDLRTRSCITHARSDAENNRICRARTKSWSRDWRLCPSRPQIRVWCYRHRRNTHFMRL